MKNRTVIGVICMVLAVVITFAVAPLVNRLTSGISEVVRLSTDVKQGVQITAEHLETVKVKTDTIPEGAVTDPNEIIGKYADVEHKCDKITDIDLTICNKDGSGENDVDLNQCRERAQSRLKASQIGRAHV